jgi:hypothetical protein
VLLQQALQARPEQVVIVDDDDTRRFELRAVVRRGLGAIRQGRSFP